MSSIRTVLSLTTSLNLEIEQLNVKTTFLYGDLEEEIYMEQLESFKVDSKKKIMCKCGKSLYSSKKTPKQ